MIIYNSDNSTLHIGTSHYPGYPLYPGQFLIYSNYHFWGGGGGGGAAASLRCCPRAFSICGEKGLVFVAVGGLLIAVASRCGARALGARASVVVAHGL